MPTNSNINSDNPIQVARGGSGVASNSLPYGILCGGTTSSGPIQNIAGLGTSGQVLTSNGAGALPTFQNAPAGTQKFDLISYKSQSGLVLFNNLSGYNIYFLTIAISNIVGSPTAFFWRMRISTDNGSTYLTTGIRGGINSSTTNSSSNVNFSNTAAFPLTLNGSWPNNSSMTLNLYINNVNSSNRFMIHGIGSLQTPPGAGGQYYSLICGDSSATNVNAFAIDLTTALATVSGDYYLYGFST